jgi:hypothetical protein
MYFGFRRVCRNPSFNEKLEKPFSKKELCFYLKAMNTQSLICKYEPV